MNSELQVIPSEIENVLINGDLGKLNPEQRVNFYNSVCSSLKLNPLTKPFDYIILNQKMQLYARKDTTDQLRKLWDVSIEIVDRKQIGDIFMVTARAKIMNRQDESLGAVPVNGLKGAALANAYMKAETKAKRRVTLSICGLGFTDESELSQIRDAKFASPDVKDMNQLVSGSVDDIKEPEISIESDLEKIKKATEEETPTDVKANDVIEGQEQNITDDQGESVGTEEDKTITSKQRQRLFAIARSKGFKDTDTREIMLRHIGCKSTKQLTPPKYEILVQLIQDVPREELLSDDDSERA